METGQVCKLLALPAEIQLYIYELAVTEETPLLVNPACDSSYRSKNMNYGQYNVAKRAWKEGLVQQPRQPALSKVCRAIRPDALELYYRCNVFRVRYCRSTPKAWNAQEFVDALDWTKRIGGDNAARLAHLYLYDRNSAQDQRSPHDLKHAMREFVAIGASVEKVQTKRCCLHRLTFGEKCAQQKNDLTEKQIDALVDRVMNGEY